MLMPINGFLWVRIGPSSSLCNVMGPNGSLWVLIRSYETLWVLIDHYRSLCVLMGGLGPYWSLCNLM